MYIQCAMKQCNNVELPDRPLVHTIDLTLRPHSPTWWDYQYHTGELYLLQKCKKENTILIVSCNVKSTFWGGFQKNIQVVLIYSSLFAATHYLVSAIKNKSASCARGTPPDNAHTNSTICSSVITSFACLVSGWVDFGKCMIYLYQALFGTGCVVVSWGIVGTSLTTSPVKSWTFYKKTNFRLSSRESVCFGQ